MKDLRRRFGHAGLPDPEQPEKHQCLFTVDRRPKRVVQAVFQDLRPEVVQPHPAWRNHLQAALSVSNESLHGHPFNLS